MSISLVTTRKGGTGEAMMAATRKLKVRWRSMGPRALCSTKSWPDPIRPVDYSNLYINWKSFGKVMQAASNDPALSEAVAGLDALSEVISRRLLASLDL